MYGSNRMNLLVSLVVPDMVLTERLCRESDD